MGDIGEPERYIELEPLPVEVPVEPKVVPEPEPEPAR